MVIIRTNRNLGVVHRRIRVKRNHGNSQEAAEANITRRGSSGTSQRGRSESNGEEKIQKVGVDLNRENLGEASKITINKNG